MANKKVAIQNMLQESKRLVDNFDPQGNVDEQHRDIMESIRAIGIGKAGLASPEQFEAVSYLAEKSDNDKWTKGLGIARISFIIDCAALINDAVVRDKLCSLLTRKPYKKDFGGDKQALTKQMSEARKKVTWTTDDVGTDIDFIPGDYDPSFPADQARLWALSTNQRYGPQAGSSWPVQLISKKIGDLYFEKEIANLF